jgi:hypothetical protein
MITPEGREKKKVRAYLRSIGGYGYYPIPMGMGVSTLDDLWCLGGKFVAIEYKREGAVPTPRQQAIMKEIHRAGGIAIWGDSADMIKEKLREALGLPD